MNEVLNDSGHNINQGVKGIMHRYHSPIQKAILCVRRKKKKSRLNEESIKKWKLDE